MEFYRCYGLCFPQERGKTLPGAYSGLRLLRGNALDSMETDLKRWIVRTLIEAPTYDYKWMGSLSKTMQVRPKQTGLQHGVTFVPRMQSQ